MTKEEKDKMFKEQPRPSAWGGWGFCSQLCSQTNYKGYITLHYSTVHYITVQYITVKYSTIKYSKVLV